MKLHPPERIPGVVLGLLLILAGLAKVTDPPGFHGDLLSYGLPAPDLLLRAVAVSLPWFELALGVCLLAGWWRGTAALAAAVLGAVFAGLLVQGMLRGLELRCGCFGTWLPGWAEHPAIALARAFLLLAGCAWLWRRNPAS
jgi:putative oxidoreductase